MSRHAPTIWQRIAPTERWWIWGILLLAAVERLWRLGSLPPGLTTTEATVGLASLNVIHHHLLWTNATGPFGAAYNWLAAIPVSIFGHNVWSLRLVATLTGIALVGGVYCWLLQWRGRRDALIGALIVATLPWSIGLAREAGPASLVAPTIVWWLWLVGRAKSTGSVKWALLAGGLLGLAPYLATSLWWLVVVAMIGLIAQLARREAKVKLWTGGGLIAIFLLLPGVLRWLHHGHHFTLPPAQGALTHLGSAFGLYISAGGGWSLTFGGQALLNALYVIMLVLGLLMAAIKRGQLGWLGLAWLGSLVVLSWTWPASAQVLALGLVPAVALITIGLDTMLERWYATFPINSAARGIGRTVVALVLALAVYQGYVQYFVAFADSTLTHIAYNEDVMALASAIHKSPSAVVVTSASTASIIDYLDYPAMPPILAPATVQSRNDKASLYLIGTGAKEQMVGVLKSVAPGGTLQAHLSPFDGRELYYTYTVK